MDINQLVASAHSATGCWVQHLSGEPRTFMEAVNVELDEGIKFSPRAIVDIFHQNSWDGLPAYSTIRHHLHQDCGCWTR